MTDTALVPKEITGGPLSQANFDEIVKSGDYLPRVQLFGGNSDECKEGRIGIGRYGLVLDKNVVDLTPEIDIAVLSWRPKAMHIENKQVLATSYDPQSAVFLKLRELAGVKDSGAMFGPEFLIYLPSQQTFATFYMASKTAKREAKNLLARLGMAATLKINLIKTAKYTWHGPVVTPCSAPITMPDLEDIQDQITKFQNPPAAPELTPVEPDATRAR